MENIEVLADKMLLKLLSFATVSPRPNELKECLIFPLKKLLPIIKTSQGIFMSQPSLLGLQAPIKIVGDLHGQFFDLLRLFEYGGYPPANSYLFLGNYVNGGNNGIQVFLLLILLKIKYPQSIYLLRGNHESKMMCSFYGFFHQCQHRYSQAIYRAFLECFSYLPLAAIVSDSILCVHGGLSPQIKSISDIFEIERPIDSTEEGVVCDLLWSDPSETVFFWGNNPKRKVGCCFGISALEQFLENNKLQLLCRSHEMVESGYRLSFRSRLVTLFSAPNYLKYYKNSASFLSVKQDLECMIMCLRGRPKQKTTKLGTSKTKMIEQGENEEQAEKTASIEEAKKTQ